VSNSPAVKLDIYFTSVNTKKEFMKKYYPGPAKSFFAYSIKSFVLFVAVSLISALSTPANAQQGLIFKNSVLLSGTAGQDGAVYRFSLVTTNVDALVKINGRSSSSVKLLDIDLTGMGWDKSFQPQVTCSDNNTTPAGTYD